ncbi:MAG: PEP-CTERM system TPR-repeat protein PrsT [Burkholderiales bacterium]|nr:PEP-CTERM system TPR-repeat protein PrsT [Burkholderiales bacterium]
MDGMRRNQWGAAAILVACAIAVGGCSAGPQRSMERINAFRAKGDYAAAAIEVRNALKDHASDGAVLLLAGQVLAEIGELPNAENALRRALEMGQPAAAVVPELGVVLLQLEKYPELLEALKSVPAGAAAGSPELAILRGRAFLGLGKLLEAKTEFHVSRNARATPAANLGLAQVALAENDRPAAERHLAEALAADPRLVDAHLTKAEMLRRAGESDAAGIAYRQAVELNPHHPGALAGLSLFEISRDALDSARVILQAAEKAAPQHPRVRFARAALAFRQKRNVDAIAELAKLLEVIPHDGPALLLMGRAQYAVGRYDRAQIAFSAYLRHHAPDPQVLRMLAGTMLARGQPHIALNVLAPLLPQATDIELMLVASDAYRMTGRFGQAREMLQRVLKLEPANAPARTSLALIDLASGSRDRAVAGLEAAIALRPGDARADEALVMVFLGRNQLDRAAGVAGGLAERLPDLSTTHVLLAAVRVARRDFDGARVSLERALKLDPSNMQALEALADVDAGQGLPDRRRERLEGILKADPTSLAALLALARLDLAQGRHDQGVARVRRALAAHPDSANALLLLADAQFRHGQTAEAVISARQAHELHPYDARAIAILGEAQLASGDKRAAIATLTKLTALQPAAVSGYLRLAAAHIAAGDAKGAAASVATALEKAPGDRGALALLADILVMNGEAQRALALGLRLQKESPREALGYRVEGDALLAGKEYAKAVEAYRKAAAIRVNGALLVRLHRAQSAASGRAANEGALREWVDRNPDDIETRLYLADVLGATGRHREAADELRIVLKRTPNSARALNNLAWNLHAAGDRRALDYARQAFALAPGNAAVADTFGWILVEQGNLAEGVPNLLKAVELDPENPEVRYHLVQALVRIGDTRRARAELDVLLGKKPAFPQLAEAQALAGRLKQ